MRRPPETVTPAVAERAGALLGRFHAEVAGLDPAGLTVTLPGFHDLGGRLDALRAVLEADPAGRAAGAAREIDRTLGTQWLVGLADDLTRGVPRRVAHNDAKLDNILFREGAALCLVDLDTIMPGAWFWDVGDLLRTAATTAREDEPRAAGVRVDPELYDRVLAGYRRAATTSTDVELEALGAAGAVVTYEQAVRFLTDWLAGDVYFKTTRPGQNLDRARTQLALLASMPGPERDR